VLESKPDLLHLLNRELTRTCWELVSGARPKVFVGDEALDLDPSLGATARLVEICKKVGADRYLSGPRASAYLDEGAFGEAGIEVEYMRYDYAPYAQQHGPFVPQVSIVDVLMNLGLCSLDAALAKPVAAGFKSAG
jgi:hypothetical protein